MRCDEIAKAHPSLLLSSLHLDPPVSHLLESRCTLAVKSLCLHRALDLTLDERPQARLEPFKRLSVGL